MRNIKSPEEFKRKIQESAQNSRPCRFEKYSYKTLVFSKHVRKIA